MEQALQLWGPAAVILSVLIVIIRWFMSFIDGQAQRIERITQESNLCQVKMTEGFTKTIQDHIIKVNETLAQNSRAIDELCHILKSTNGNKIKAP